MKYTPKPKNKKAEIASLVLLLTAVVLFFFAAQYYTKGRAIVQGLGVACLSLGAFFIVKRMTSYTYFIYPKDSDKEADVTTLSPSELTFTVTKKNGKRSGTNAAQLDLDALKSVTPLPPSGSEKRKVLADFGKMPLYYYTVTILPPDAYLLVFEHGGERTGIVIEPNETFRVFLEEAAKVNNEE